MILGIFGRSACGKSTLAEIVSHKLGIPVRHCGEEIKAAAKAAGCNPSSAPDNLHRAVDRETRRWCENLIGDGVVEGRFLDAVLADTPGVVLVELATPTDERARRLSDRLGQAVSEQEIGEIDADSDLFRNRMYPRRRGAPGAHRIETLGGKAEECAQRLISLMSRPRAPEPG